MTLPLPSSLGSLFRSRLLDFLRKLFILPPQIEKHLLNASIINVIRENILADFHSLNYASWHLNFNEIHVRLSRAFSAAIRRFMTPSRSVDRQANPNEKKKKRPFLRDVFSSSCTIIYLHIERALFLNAPPDEYHVKVAKTQEEVTQLLETGFEHALQKDDLAYFRKRK